MPRTSLILLPPLPCFLYYGPVIYIGYHRCHIADVMPLKFICNFRFTPPATLPAVCYFFVYITFSFSHNVKCMNLKKQHDALTPDNKQIGRCLYHLS